MIRSLFLRLLRCFTSAGSPHAAKQRGDTVLSRVGFSHSEIPGSKVGSHLPEAYRRHPTPFIASISQVILHLPINSPICKANRKTVLIFDLENAIATSIFRFPFSLFKVLSFSF